MTTIGSAKRKSRAIASLIGISVTLGLAGCDETNTDTDFKSIDTSAPVSDWQMVWSDDFDGDSIDSSKWFHEVNCTGGGNQEKQCYTDSAENSFVADGMLNIIAKPAEEDSPQPYTSARLSTKGLGDFKYGRFEMRAKLPFGQGSHPAFWMLPTDDVYGGWPNSGEIDILEAVNLKTIDDEGVTESKVIGTLHYGKDAPNNSKSGKEYLMPDGANPADDFHTYAIEWQEGEMRWYVDGYLYQTQMASQVRYNSKDQAVGLTHRGWFTEYFDIISGDLETHWDASPYDQEFHMLLNLAVGGTWAENVNDGGIDPAAFVNGQTYAIDYVRVYECSVDVETGKGCDTIRSGYKSEEDALVLGAAPLPKPPSTGIPVNLTIFSDTENPSWPIWGDNGDIDPTIQTEEDEHGAVVEFSIGATPTVMGFNVYESESPLGFDASPMVSAGNVSFDMKVVSPPSDASATWHFKIESNGQGGEEAEFELSEGNEGIAPVVGEWQTYTFSLQSLSDAGLDLSNIDVLMIFPSWGASAGAVYRVDNVTIAQEGGPGLPELVLFENGPHAEWLPSNCCAGDVPSEETDDDEHGNTIEFVIGDTDTVVGFTPSDLEKSFDATAIMSDGVVQFEMKIISAPTDTDAAWFMSIESTGGIENGNIGEKVEIALNLSQEAAVPVVGEWQTYTYTLSELVAINPDFLVDDITTVWIFPTWGKGNGAVFRIDNAKIYSPGGASEPNGDDNSSTPGLTLFEDATASGWAKWDCCSDTTPSIELDDDAHGNTVEFSMTGSTAETVMGFNSRTSDGGAGISFDASTLVGNGVIQFEMKLITPADDGDVAWKLKLESNGGEQGNPEKEKEFDFTESNEGEAPALGEWKTYTFNLADLYAEGFDVSAIDVVMIFPAWGTGAGAVYRIDNLKIANP
ncbi:glycoside hydrolase family 16 protein [Thalassotalea psychrophila]|uniref:Glycoside hydrolase family 16 protein n=1 Tax=Thalassotalea psychrophila TaxID=3065647 RepID=A0ABY9TSC8_9GAMM|nr:glycoside hydrolase family 16 protein [Colwelliaceae bacterium SQ149]